MTLASPGHLASASISAARAVAAASSSSSTSTPSVALFTRYVFAVQYHGGNFLGFTYQGQRGEDCIVFNNNNTDNNIRNKSESHTKIMAADLRGVESVEGRIRKALDKLVGNKNYSNIKVSSRTDRGVHAWRNTFQVDIRQRISANMSDEEYDADATTATTIRLSIQPSAASWCPRNLVNGLNFYLCRLSNCPLTFTPTNEDDNDANAENSINASNRNVTKRQRYRKQMKSVHSNDTPALHSHNQTVNSAVRILSSAIAPSVTIPNKRYNPNLPECKINNPQHFPWDVRLTATRRTYAYRILHSYEDDDGDRDALNSQSGSSVGHQQGDGDHRHYDPTIVMPNSHMSTCYDSHPFEYDRVWRIHEKEIRRRYRSTKQDIVKGLDVVAMNDAAQHLIGTHDFSSFRGKGCQRSSPIVTLEDIWIDQERYHDNAGHGGGVLGAVWKRRRQHNIDKKQDCTTLLPVLHNNPTLRLITVVITGKSFLYRQVRNMVACLVDVGRGKLRPDRVKEILEKRDRRYASGMAPAQGLFLVDVEHGEFKF
jgi:tRNA pseudouridine(38-40) synthase